MLQRAEDLALTGINSEQADISHIFKATISIQSGIARHNVHPQNAQFGRFSRMIRRSLIDSPLKGRRENGYACGILQKAGYSIFKIPTCPSIICSLLWRSVA